jgi:hypothetical protein
MLNLVQHLLRSYSAAACRVQRQLRGFWQDIVTCNPETESGASQLDNLLLHGGDRPALKVCDFGYSRADDDSHSTSACGEAHPMLDSRHTPFRCQHTRS